MSAARKVLLAAGALVVVALAVGYVQFVAPLRVAADIGAGFVAKQMCSCIHVAGRDFESCRPDMRPVMDRIEAQATPDGDGIHAFIPLLASRTAVYREGLGCTLL